MTTPAPLAIVTGASSGIGAATALALGAQGWRVVLVARGREALAEVASKFAAPGRAIVEPLDASDGEAVLAMARRVIASEGAPDAIVNSAGAGQWKYLEDTPPSEALQMLGAPFLAAANVTHAFLAAMLERRRGVVIHVGSPASIQTWPGATVYTASRWALRGLHEALDQDLRGTGVRSCHVLFGKVSSEYFQRNPDSEEHIPRIGTLIPESTPEACAKVIVRTIARPRRTVYAPAMLGAFAFCRWLMPGPMRWLAGVTGRRHPAVALEP